MVVGKCYKYLKGYSVFKVSRIEGNVAHGLVVAHHCGCRSKGEIYDNPIGNAWSAYTGAHDYEEVSEEEVLLYRIAYQ
jgi:hypothetical protein